MASLAGASLTERILLVVTDVFSIMLSTCPFVIFKSTGSWSTTRKIFPAKSVACNFGGAFMWTLYMDLQMYLSYGYSGLDALWVNCLSMAFDVAVLLLYFKDGKEHLKFGICLGGSIILVSVFLGILVFHPYTAPLTGHAISSLNWWSTFTAILGIITFAILNLIPFKDLWNMSLDENRNVTLDWLMELCTLLNCVVSFMWTIYAWVFPSSTPNFFLYANLIAALLSLIQCFWLGAICLHHRKVEGQLTDAESLRMIFLELAETLDDMASVPYTHAFWKRTGFFRDFLEHMSVVTQSFSKIRLALEQQLPILQEKINTAAVREALIKDAATTLAHNAKYIVQTAACAANEGTAAAAAAHLATQEAAGLSSHRRAMAAVVSFNTRFHGEPPAQQNQLQAAAHGEQGDGNVVPDGPTFSTMLTLSETIQEGADAANTASCFHALAAAEAGASQVDARAACSSCSNLIAACNMCEFVFEAASTAISNKLNDAKGNAQTLNAAQANILQVARTQAICTAIKDCPPRLRFIASRVRSSLQVINATVGIPAPLQGELHKAHEDMLVLKIIASSPFFYRRLEKKFRRWIGKG